MKTVLRALAMILLVGGVGFWAIAGANRGWTKTSVPKATVDEVTGIEGMTYEERFVPGVDFLGAALFGAIVLSGVSFLFRSKSNSPTNQTIQ